MVRYKTIGQFSAESGFSEGAIRKMIERKIWKEREVWVRANGRILIAVDGYHYWVETESGLSLAKKAKHIVNFGMKRPDEEEVSRKSPQLPIC
jgi:hypothetical protein